MNRTESFWKYKLRDWVRDFTSLGNPIILILVPLWVLGPGSEMIHLLLALAANEIICSAIKLIFHRKRPDEQNFESPVEKLDAGSFPSIHASRISIVYLALFASAEFLWLKMIFISIIIIVGFSRVYLKRHYWTDVLAGWMIGGIIWAIFHFLIFA